MPLSSSCIHYTTVDQRTTSSTHFTIPTLLPFSSAGFSRKQFTRVTTTVSSRCRIRTPRLPPPSLTNIHVCFLLPRSRHAQERHLDYSFSHCISQYRMMGAVGQVARNGTGNGWWRMISARSERAMLRVRDEEVIASDDSFIVHLWSDMCYLQYMPSRGLRCRGGSVGIQHPQPYYLPATLTLSLQRTRL